MHISAAFAQMAVLFIVLAVGYAANKFGVVTAESNRHLSKVAVNIAMPCTILSSVMGGKASATSGGAAFFLAASFLVFLLAFLVAAPLPRLLSAGSSQDAGMYRFMVVFGNVGFMGFPVVQALFGDGALFYVTLFNIAYSLLCFSAGIALISGKGGKVDYKLFVNPTMITSIAAVAIFYFSVPVPSVISDSVSLLGHMTTPLAMLVIGSTLAGMKFSEVFSDVKVYPVTAAKLAVMPLLTWLIFRPFVSDPLMLGVLIVLSGMPTATTAAMLSMEYGGNELLASKGIFVTTLLSVATVPLIAYFLR